MHNISWCKPFSHPDKSIVRKNDTWGTQKVSAGVREPYAALL